MATGVSFENYTADGHVVDVDWPAVTAGVTIYGEWESPPCETSPATAGCRTTEITSKYSLSRMAVVPQTFADFTASFGPQLTAAGGEC